MDDDERELLELIATVLGLADETGVVWPRTWASGGAAPLITLLGGHEQRLLYIPPERIVHHAAATCRGRRQNRSVDRISAGEPCRDCARCPCRWLGSLPLMDNEDVPRDPSRLVVPLLGSPEATGDLFAPYRLADDGGSTVEPAAAFFAE